MGGPACGSSRPDSGRCAPSALASGRGFGCRHCKRPTDPVAWCTTVQGRSAPTELFSAAYGLLAARMILALVIGVPLALIVVYGFWLAGQLGRGPSWRRASKRNHS